MTQTAALLDADLSPYFDDSASEITAAPSRPMQWVSDAAVTVVMVLLAPILFIPVALAFAIACVRTQRFDRRSDPARERRHYRSARERFPVRTHLESAVRSLDARVPTVGAYRWN
jgi:hypothetical protein